MLHALLLALPALACGGDAAPHAPVPAARPAVAMHAAQTTSLETVYNQGLPFALFLAGVSRRREVWDQSVLDARVPEELAERARAVGGRWRLLIITEPGCSDSANTVPYIVRLAERAAGMEVRLVTSDAGRPWMEAHRTPDGRAATPTVLLLDEAYRIRGCWVEQPAALQKWWLPALANNTATRRFDEKMQWYRTDRGRETMREFVELLEAAVAGPAVCPGLAAAR